MQEWPAFKNVLLDLDYGKQNKTQFKKMNKLIFETKKLKNNQKIKKMKRTFKAYTSM